MTDIGSRPSKRHANPFLESAERPVVKAAPVAGAEPVGEEPASAVATVSTPKRRNPPGTTKYTAYLDAQTAATFDELALIARRKLGRKVDKVELLKVLVLLAADDGSLRDQVIDEVGKVGDDRG